MCDFKQRFEVCVQVLKRVCACVCARMCACGENALLCVCHHPGKRALANPLSEEERQEAQNRTQPSLEPGPAQEFQ